MVGARYMTLETIAPLLHHAMGYDPPESPLRLLRCVDDCLWHTFPFAAVQRFGLLSGALLSRSQDRRQANS